MSLRDTIAEAADLAAEQVDIPEWGVTIEVRTFTVATRAQWAEQMSSFQNDDGTVKAGGMAEMYPAMLIAACYDPATGEPLFTPADAAMLRGKNGAVVDRIADRILTINGLKADSVDSGKAGFSETPNGGSGSA